MYDIHSPAIITGKRIECCKCHGAGTVVNPDFKPMSYASASKVIREVAQEVRKTAREYSEGDADMLSMYLGDAKDLREVAKILLTGDADAALEYARALDTGARENIPDGPYEFMLDNLKREER